MLFPTLISLDSNTSYRYARRHRRWVRIDYGWCLSIDHSVNDCCRGYWWSSRRLLDHHLHRHRRPHGNSTGPGRTKPWKNPHSVFLFHYFEIFVIVFHGERVGVQCLFVTRGRVVAKDQWTREIVFIVSESMRTHRTRTIHCDCCPSLPRVLDVVCRIHFRRRSRRPLWCSRRAWNIYARRDCVEQRSERRQSQSGQKRILDEVTFHVWAFLRK